MVYFMLPEIYNVFVTCRKYKSKEWWICCPEQSSKIPVCAASPHHGIHLHCGQTTKRSGVIHIEYFPKKRKNNLYIMVLVRGTASTVQLDPSSVIVMEIFHHADMQSWWLYLIHWCLLQKDCTCYFLKALGLCFILVPAITTPLRFSCFSMS